MHEIANKGGLANVSKKSTINSFRGCRDDTFICKNKHNNVNYHSFRHEFKSKPMPFMGKEVIKKHEEKYFQALHCYHH